jgi:hypothetical protein
VGKRANTPRFWQYKRCSKFKLTIQSINMVFNKLIFLASIAIFGLVTVNADQIEDWCPPCKRLIDDFAPELKTTQVQEVRYK